MEDILDTFEEVLRIWLHTYASEFCEEKEVEKAQQKLHSSGGTLAYIADNYQKIAQWRKGS